MTLIDTQWCSAGLAGQSLTGDNVVWVVFDTETTGLRPERDRLTEFAAIVVDSHGTVLHVSSWVTADGPALLRERAAELEWFVQHGILVAHNLRFDLAMLERAEALRGLAVAAPPRWLCTMRLTGRPLSLDALAGLVGVQCHERHTAVGDARALSVVVARLLDAARRRGLGTVGGLAVVCPAGHRAVNVERGGELTGWQRVRSSLDHVVPTRFPEAEHRNAIRRAWEAGAPTSTTEVDTVVADLVVVGVTAVVFDACLHELQAAGQSSRDT